MTPATPVLALLLSVAMLSGCDSHRSASASGGSYAGGGRYSTGELEQDDDESDAEDAEAARSEFADAANELQAAVEDLRTMEWRTQMGEIRDKLEDAETALEPLESLRPSHSAVAAARHRIDEMRSHVDRLHFENWRHVAPALSDTSSDISDEAAAMSLDDD